jgi:hypothetical protein
MSGMPCDVGRVLRPVGLQAVMHRFVHHGELCSHCLPICGRHHESLAQRGCPASTTPSSV